MINRPFKTYLFFSLLLFLITALPLFAEETITNDIKGYESFIWDMSVDEVTAAINSFSKTNEDSEENPKAKKSKTKKSKTQKSKIKNSKSTSENTTSENTTNSNITNTSSTNSNTSNAIKKFTFKFLTPEIEYKIDKKNKDKGKIIKIFSFLERAAFITFNFNNKKLDGVTIKMTVTNTEAGLQTFSKISKSLMKTYGRAKITVYGEDPPAIADKIKKISEKELSFKFSWVKPSGSLVLQLEGINATRFRCLIIYNNKSSATSP